MEFLIKVVISALLVAAVSVVGRRSSAIAAILASLPVTSILALTWLYLDTKDVGKVRELSLGIFWAVLPSLLFFLALYTLLKFEMQFWWALVASCGVMIVSYSVYLVILKRFGIVI